jgi:8-oxo-dGTP pyrophosphatase MutT (NUDIX family)
MKPLKQVGALCICESADQKPLILLVTSRDTGRWVIPKGWPEKRLEPYDAAAREAMEEAGVAGKVATRPIGRYQYVRPHPGGDQLHNVSVYLIAARSAFDRWPEYAQRKRGWFSISSAARRVAEPELRRLIRGIGTLIDHPKWRSISELTTQPDRKTRPPTKSATGHPKRIARGKAVSHRRSVEG